MLAMRFRIRDLLTGRTLIESERGRDLVAYHHEHYQPGRCDWLWQYEGSYGWTEIPLGVRRMWRERSATLVLPAPPT